MEDLFTMGYEDKIEVAKNAPCRTIRLLSLFSGIGAFEKALDKCGIPYELVAYCEIDKYASKAYSAIHGVPEDKNLWDVCNVDAKPYEGTIDLLTYGFPCTDISVAGQQKGFFDEEGNYTRSGLFFEALRIIKDCKPRIAIAENVKNLMGQSFLDAYHTVQESLDEAGYNNYVQVLNAKNYGIPQNRERVFIISIRKDIDIGYIFPEPMPLQLCLKDMLEDKVDEKYYLSEKTIQSFEEHARRNAENGNGFGWNVVDIGSERERESKGEKNWQCSGQGNAEQNDIRQFRLESDTVRRDGSREHDALCARNGMQGYGIANLDGVNATITANGGGLAKTGGNLIVEKFDG